MPDLRDDLRAFGTVEVECAACGWAFWLEPVDPMLLVGPLVCPPCADPVAHGVAPAKVLDDLGTSAILS